MTATANPPWVDRVLNQHIEAISHRFGDMAPVHDEPKRARAKLKFREFGCGSYGCVLPTDAPGIVFKVTSDPTEAVFVTVATKIYEETKIWPEGMVRYYGLFQVPEGSHKRRPVYVLARQEAEKVGELAHGTMEKQQFLLESRVSKRLSKFKQFASIARDKITKSMNPRRVITEVVELEDWAKDTVDYEEATSLRDTYPPRPPVPKHFESSRAAAYAIQACRYVAQEMINEDVGYLIGGALDFYLDHGMLLADVHTGNIGLVQLEDYTKKTWTITDPGHMVPLDARWLDLEVPVL